MQGISIYLEKVFSNKVILFLVGIKLIAIPLKVYIVQAKARYIVSVFLYLKEFDYICPVIS